MGQNPTQQQQGQKPIPCKSIVDAEATFTDGKKFTQSIEIFHAQGASDALLMAEALRRIMTGGGLLGDGDGGKVDFYPLPGMHAHGDIGENLDFYPSPIKKIHFSVKRVTLASVSIV